MEYWNAGCRVIGVISFWITEIPTNNNLKIGF
jgi:hypothetical protein